MKTQENINPNIDRGATLVTLNDLINVYKIGKKTHIYRLIKDGEFLKPMKFGRFNKWRVKDVEEWIEQRVQETQGTIN